MQTVAATIVVFFFIILVVMLFSLPFAFVGWAVVTFAGLFMDMGDFSYWGCAAAGLATCVVVGLIASISGD